MGPLASKVLKFWKRGMRTFRGRGWLGSSALGGVEEVILLEFGFQMGV